MRNCRLIQDGPGAELPPKPRQQNALRAEDANFDLRDYRLIQDGAGAKLRDCLGFYRRNRFHGEFFLLNGLQHELLYRHETSPGFVYRNVRYRNIRESQSLYNLYILTGLPTSHNKLDNKKQKNIYRDDIEANRQDRKKQFETGCPPDRRQGKSNKRPGKSEDQKAPYPIFATRHAPCVNKDTSQQDRIANSHEERRPRKQIAHNAIIRQPISTRVKYHAGKNITLFVAQGNYGVDAHGAARRNVTRGERYRGQDHSYASERKRIGGAHAVQHAGHQTCQRQSGHNADAHTDQRHLRAVTENQPQPVTTLRSQRDAYAELARLLPHQIRNDAVDSQARKQQREQRERAEENHRKTLARNRAGNNFVHGLRARHNLFAVHALNGVPYRIEQPGLRPLRTHHRAHAHRRERHGGVRQLHERKVKLRTKTFGIVGIESPLLHVSRHAHNLRREFGLADFQE